MKKIINKSSIFTFILGILFCNGIIYGVNLYKSEDIQYTPTDNSWEVDNVNDALNDLYNIKKELDNIKNLGDATSSDIEKDKTAVVNGELVTGIKLSKLKLEKTNTLSSTTANHTITIPDYEKDYVIILLTHGYTNMMTGALISYDHSTHTATLHDGNVTTTINNNGTISLSITHNSSTMYSTYGSGTGYPPYGGTVYFYTVN